MGKPNVLIILADQWRRHALGYTGNSQVRTPNIDSFAGESIELPHALSGCPACSPFRASLLTGQYPLRHGIFLNDAPLNTNDICLGDAFKAAGYRTGYIGKWHVDGRGRSACIPAERRGGFEYWRTLECTHNYHRSDYYRDDERETRRWKGYDAFAQTEEACAFLDAQSLNHPFCLVLSWGPPHDPYETAPEEFRRLYTEEEIDLHPNVPKEVAAEARQKLAGYYAHCSALDFAFGKLMEHLDTSDFKMNTIVLFLSDHGDMLGSHGGWLKQQPWDESIRIPFLLRHPRLPAGKREGIFMDGPDIMPTLLGLCEIESPGCVDGRDYSASIREDGVIEEEAGFIASYHPFGNWSSARGGREYRGLRTKRYTYVRELSGPWLLFDNLNDPYQLYNLIEDSAYSAAKTRLDERLEAMLKLRGDSFSPGMDYVEAWRYQVDEDGTIPI